MLVYELLDEMVDYGRVHNEDILAPASWVDQKSKNDETIGFSIGKL